MEEGKNYLHYIAGALLILVLLSKGTTGALIISAVCVVLIFNKKQIDWVRGGIGFVATGLLFFVASQTIWPEMLPDIFMSPVLSHVGEYDMIGQIGVTAIATAISMSIYIPIVGLGAVYGSIWIKNHFDSIEAKLLIISWIAPLCIVWAQSESFAYQYFLFALPAIVGLVLYERDTPKEKKGKLKLKRENIIATSIIILFVMWVLLYMPFVSYYGEQEQKMNEFFWNDSKIINEQFNLPNQTSILYMDTGSLPYYVNGANTSCRYPAPLILQRMNPNRTIVSTLPAYEEEYLCVMNYSSRYILADGPLGKADGWFGVDSSEKVSFINKVNMEYKNVHNGAWSVYERKNESGMVRPT
ncbi:MAG: hypothetical protein PHS04_17285 [Tissierellia bacterium]|nr:hypothetical protein [Tissierellia bacterium]